MAEFNFPVGPRATARPGGSAVAAVPDRRSEARRGSGEKQFQRSIDGDRSAADERGFTLIELLTVMAIVAALAGLTFGVIHGVKQQSALARARAELAGLAQALEEFRRQYGDYPQTGDCVHAAAPVAEPVQASTGEAKLFNALVGRAGPKLDAIEGRAFVELGGFSCETTELPSAANSGQLANALLDPWGRRYQFYYRSQTAPAAWQAPAYLLYSAGPDGDDAAPDKTTGTLDATKRENADNLYAHP